MNQTQCPWTAREIDSEYIRQVLIARAKRLEHDCRMMRNELPTLATSALKTIFDSSRALGERSRHLINDVGRFLSRHSDVSAEHQKELVQAMLSARALAVDIQKEAGELWIKRQYSLKNPMTWVRYLLIGLGLRRRS